MCGRTSCSCRPETYRSACSYYDSKKDKFIKPPWLDGGGQKFVPSTNIAPTDFSPVLAPGSFWEDSEAKKILCPMKWGIVPSWSKDASKSHSLATHNCRIENITSSKLYSPSIQKGKRCVLVCEGFYEWQQNGKQKQPYFIYSPQKDDNKPEEANCWENGTFSENIGWVGPNLLYLAGIFSETQSSTDETERSFSVITTESSEKFKFIHHRMPAVLSTVEQIDDWLDVDGFKGKDALELLKADNNLCYHPVSTLVNNSRNKDPSCNKRKKKENSFMDSWLNKGKKKCTGD